MQAKCIACTDAGRSQTFPVHPSQQLVLQDGSPFGFSPSPVIFVNGISETWALTRVLKSANVEWKPLGFFQSLLQDSISVIYNEIFVTAHHSLAITRQNSITRWPNSPLWYQYLQSRFENLKSNYILKHIVWAHLAQQNVKYNFCVAFPTEGSHCAWFIWNRLWTLLKHNTKQTPHKTGTSSRTKTKPSEEDDIFISKS